MKGLSFVIFIRNSISFLFGRLTHDVKILLLLQVSEVVGTEHITVTIVLIPVMDSTQTSLVIFNLLHMAI